VKCLLYARVSTDKQAQKELSIPAQLDAMKNYVRSNTWSVVGSFIDRGESARTADRPELKKLISRCRQDKAIQVVIVHKIDRLARNLVDFATIKAVLKQHGVRLISVSEPFDDNPIGQLLENILASISEWYSANLGEEIKKSHSAKLKKGEWPHKPPVGYISVKSKTKSGRPKHIPDPQTGPLVCQSFELFATGNYSLKTLSDEMAERGLQTRYGRIYSSESMKKLLSKKFYIGRMEWKGREYNGVHRPLISKKKYYDVQQVLCARSADTGEKGKLRFLLRGITFCSECVQRLTAENHPRGSYYRCPTNIHKDNCDQPYTPVQQLDKQLEVLYAQLKQPDSVLQLVKTELILNTDKRKRAAEKELGSIKKAIDDAKEKQLKLLEERLDATVAPDIYQKMEKRLSDQISSLEGRLAQFRVDYDEPLDFLDKCITISSMLAFLHSRFSFSKRKQLLSAVFKRIYVRDKAIVDFKLNPPFSTLLKGDVEELFDKHTPGRSRKDIIEQLLSFTLSEEYIETRKRVEAIGDLTKVRIRSRT